MSEGDDLTSNLCALRCIRVQTFFGWRAAIVYDHSLCIASVFFKFQRHTHRGGGTPVLLLQLKKTAPSSRGDTQILAATPTR